MWSKHTHPDSRGGRRAGWPLAGLALLAGSLCGCSESELADGPDRGPGNQPVSYVRLDFAMPTAPAGRAALQPLDNPTGGEDGDGHEVGQTAENTVTDAVAFFFQPVEGAGTGANAAAATPVTAIYFPNLTATSGLGNGGDTDGTTPDAVYTTGTVETSLPNGTYQVLVLANPGEAAPTAAWWNTPGLTLGDVRDHILTTAWQTDGSGNFSDFTMTSAADATLTLASNPKDDPAKTTVDVERVAARVDYTAENSYTCTDPTYQSATVEITGAAVVNNLTAGSYLLKRVSPSTTVTDTYTYMGDETAAGTGAATNYVLDPWTLTKTADSTTFAVNRASVGCAGLYGTYLPDGSQNPNDWADLVQEGAALTGTWGGKSWRRAGYTLENVTLADESGRTYNTAVVFKARFHPAQEGTMAGYEDGETFFAWGANLYPTMEAVMYAAYGENWDDIQNDITSATTWGDVKTAAARLLTNDPSGYDDYVNGLIAEHTDEEELNPDYAAVTLGWNVYMKDFCGYSYTEANGVVLDQFVSSEPGYEKESTREVLTQYGIRTYEDATCYYTWYVRHANDADDETNGPMEYAVVRNNIYKLSVEGIYSLGDDVPGESGLMVHVYVNDWLLLDPETIEM